MISMNDIFKHTICTFPDPWVDIETRDVWKMAPISTLAITLGMNGTYMLKKIDSLEHKEPVEYWEYAMRKHEILTRKEIILKEQEYLQKENEARRVKFDIIKQIDIIDRALTYHSHDDEALSALDILKGLLGLAGHTSYTEENTSE